MKGWKFFIIILFLLSVTLFGLAFFVFMEKQAEEAHRIQVEGELSVQKAENKKLNLAYGQLTQSKKELEKILQEEKKRAKEILKALETEKKGRSRAEKDLKQNSEYLNKMKLEYQQLSQELEVLQQKLQDLGLGSPVPLSKKTPMKLTTEVEIPPVVVEAGTQQPGQVLVVNRDFNFIVVDRGSQEGLAKGEFLFIARGGKPVARVQVEKVYDHFSACGIVEEAKTRRIMEGDSVSKS